jgi:hypothetical protein
MNLITTEYFVKDISLPTGTYSNVENEIEKYEKEVVYSLFGYELGKLVLAYGAGSPQRIKDIVEGKEYTVAYNSRDQLIKWGGLKNAEKISLIAYYVYYWSQRNNVTLTANVGEVKPKQENSMNAALNQKIANSWNRLYKLYGFQGQSILEPSAYNFLNEYKDDYPEWIFTEIGQINMFGF